MAISYSTGTTGSATNIPASTAFTFTVPAGVLTGDVMFVSLNVFSFTANTFGISTPSSGGGNWTQIGTTQQGSQGSIGGWGSAWYRVATASDPGSTFTVSWTGTTTGGNQFWWAADLESYTGADTSGPIGNFAWSIANSSVTSAAGPTTTTTRANSWAIQANPASVSSSGSITGEPATNRHVVNPGAGVDNAVSDSNGSVGASGTTIGGGTWTWSNQTNGAGIMFTGELLAPAGAAPAGVVPQLTAKGRPAARKGILASILIKPPTTGGPPAKFFPPHVLLHGAATAVKGRLTGARGQPGRPSPFRQPGPLRGPAAARPGKLSGLRGRPGVPAPFTPPHAPLKGPAKAGPGKMTHGSSPQPVVLPSIPSPFVAPHNPLRGQPAARRGALAGAAAPPPVIHPNVPAPFFPPHTLLRGQAPVRARTPLTGTIAPPPVAPPAHPPHWQGSTHMPDANASGNLILGANHTGTGGPGQDLKGDFERSGD